MDWISQIAPLISTLGGGGASVALIVIVYRFVKDFAGEYRNEVERLRERVAVLESRDTETRSSLERCAEERQAMRIAMRVNGLPWNPEEW